ncbi:hypothetical protein PAXRUDRAFT_151984 [Paxillus rubicundulus Ve08.2h10]|uniref:Uncharacterized protein n=1 Tax=Paxillus rubicundulus Ve08.2h10 TaxID=930991 RepID=A0A0D0DHU6_9AGAM|nr:hypothetical protein PAXRUDRAFT_151984 [Paxillus rubicundulus Ve08.2h10]
MWILELLNGHPERIQICLGVSHDAFNGLLQLLVQHGVVPDKNYNRAVIAQTTRD